MTIQETQRIIPFNLQEALKKLSPSALPFKPQFSQVASIPVTLDGRVTKEIDFRLEKKGELKRFKEILSRTITLTSSNPGLPRLELSLFNCSSHLQDTFLNDF